MNIPATHMTVLTLTVSLSVTILMAVFALAYWRRRREQVVHGWVAFWLFTSCIFLAARLGQMVCASPILAPQLARVVITASLVTTWATFHFVTVYIGHRPTRRDYVVTSSVLGLPMVLLWLSDLVLTHSVTTRILWGRDAFLGVTTGPLYLLFPIASLAVGLVGLARLARDRPAQGPEGVLILCGYALGTLVLVADTTFTLFHEGFTPRFSDFSNLPLGLVFSFSQVERYARLYGELEERVAARTHELAEANEQLRVEFAHREALHDRLARSQRLEALGRLAGSVAHDFNNLLTIIYTASDQLDDAAGAAPAAAKPLGAIRGASTRAAALVSQLLSFARERPIAPKVLDASATVGDLSDLLHRLVGHDIVLDLQAPEALRVQIDPTQLEQIVINLVVNARDAMAGKGRIQLTLERTSKLPLDVLPPSGNQAASYVRITVSDTGHGIPKEIMDRLFEPFFTSKEEGKGTGLGLATVLGAAQQAGGYVTVASEPGQGATFEVFLPEAT